MAKKVIKLSKDKRSPTGRMMGGKPGKGKGC